MPLPRGYTSPDNESALREVLRRNPARRPPLVAHESNRNVGPERQLLQAYFGLQLAVAENVLPSRGKERIHPERAAKQLIVGQQTSVRLAGFGGNCRIRALPSDVEPMQRGGIVVQHV